MSQEEMVKAIQLTTVIDGVGVYPGVSGNAPADYGDVAVDTQAKTVHMQMSSRGVILLANCPTDKSGTIREDEVGVTILGAWSAPDIANAIDGLLSSFEPAMKMGVMFCLANREQKIKRADTGAKSVGPDLGPVEPTPDAGSQPN